MLASSVQKIDMLISDLERYNFEGLGLMITNIPEVHLMRAYRRNTRFLTLLTSYSGDYDRLRKAYFAFDSPNLKKEAGKHIRFDDIHFPMTGEHGGEIPLLSEGYINIGDKKIPLKDINSFIEDTYKCLEIEILIANSSRSYGLKAAWGEAVHGTPSKDTAASLSGLIKSISSYSRQFYGSMMCFPSEIDNKLENTRDEYGVIAVDTLINFNSLATDRDLVSTLNVSKQYIRRGKLDFESLNLHWKNELLKQIREQNRLYNKYYGKM